jgi:hypothetical protein
MAVSLTVVLGFSGLLLLRWRGTARAPEADWDWARDFSPEKYRPMQRLLCEEDSEFLKSQPGFHSSLIRALRANRRRVFRAYLRSLHRDFNRLYFAAKECATYSSRDQSELVTAIARQRAIFYWAMFQVEFRLALHWMGLGAVDVRPLLAPLNAMREVTREFQPASA